MLFIMIYGCIKQVMNVLIGNYKNGSTECIIFLFICVFII